MVDQKRVTTLITVSEAAELLNVHVNTIRRWSNQGILHGFRIGSRGDRRFIKDDIENLIFGLHENEGHVVKAR